MKERGGHRPHPEHQPGDREAQLRALLAHGIEQLAEEISYIVGQYFGVPNPFSADYLQQWENTPETLFAELETVTTTAGSIIDKLEAIHPAPRWELTSAPGSEPTSPDYQLAVTLAHGEIFPDTSQDDVQHAAL